MKQNEILATVAERVLRDAYVIRLLGEMGEELTEPFPHEISNDEPFAWGFEVLTDDEHKLIGTIMWDWNAEEPLVECGPALEDFL